MFAGLTWVHCGNARGVVLLMFLHHTKNNQSNLFLLATHITHVLWISSPSVCNFIDYLLLYSHNLIGLRMRWCGKSWKSSNFWGSKCSSHAAHNSVWQHMTSPHSMSTVTDTDYACNMRRGRCSWSDAAVIAKKNNQTTSHWVHRKCEFIVSFMQLWHSLSVWMATNAIHTRFTHDLSYFSL